ncbi:MAG: Lrp/AsnC family transcriptional regulator for asnA, asnC and gidA, partial [Alcanivorax sp.]
MNHLADVTGADNFPVDLDEIDKGVIRLLRSDGRMPYRAIARELAITESTVRARVRRLE